MRRLTHCAPFIAVLCLMWAASCTPATAQGGLHNLRCENATNPAGIKTQNPQLSWDRNPGQIQHAYQVLVASSEEKLKANEGDMWDSGIVITDQKMARYQGKSPSTLQRYYWKVRVWDSLSYSASGYTEPASWKMGLLFFDNRPSK
jgi:alpha-L-rhamnosidase